MCQQRSEGRAAVGCDSQSAAPAASGCQQSSGPSVVGDEVRWVHEGQDLAFPPVPFPSRRVFAAAGEAGIRALIERQHQYLATGPAARLYPKEERAFRAAVERVAAFMIAACGGPADSTAARGKECMRTRHFPFTIDEDARLWWLEAMWRACGDVAFPSEVREEYWNWVEAMSIRMINRRTQRAQPERIPYAEAGARWSGADAAARP